MLEEPDFLTGTLTTEFIANHPGLLHRAQEWREQQSEHFKHLAGDRRHVAAIAAAIAAAQ